MLLSGALKNIHSFSANLNNCFRSRDGVLLGEPVKLLRDGKKNAAVLYLCTSHADKVGF